MAELLLSQPDGSVLAQRKLDPTRGYWIGRESNCDIVVEDPGVSRRHAFVFQSNGRWLICDAGSVGGLTTEGGDVRSAPLSADAWVGVGSLYVWLSGAPGTPPEWIDARADITETSSGVPKITRITKLSVEDLGDAEPAAVRDLLVVSDREGSVHLVADLTGLSAARASGAPRLTIGRANTMDLQLCHPSVDPLHCVLAVGSEKWSIIDAGCAAGIMYDGKRWYRKRLERGVTLAIGDFRLSMQRITRTTPPLPPAPAPKSSEAVAKAPKRPSAFLPDSDEDSLPMQ